MTADVAEVLAGAFERGCASIGEGLCAIAVALRPSLDTQSGCTHPEDQRDHSLATMGRPRWRCACGYEYDAKAGE